MKIAILDTQKAYLPEINAYIKYFQKNGINAERVFKEDLSNVNKYDIVWKFTGFDSLKHKDVHVIHEYNSLTVGKLRWLKDKLKKNLNVKPEGRVFLNSMIEKDFKFTDNTPSIIRDMGIGKEFFVTNSNKEYDFVYIGSMDENRQLDKILHNFNRNQYNHKILMIGRPSDDLYQKFKNIGNIIFTGTVPYEEVPRLASTAIYGINYIPNIYPYNMQTSTKLLEYCALGLKVITTDYHWMKQFEKKEDANFYKIGSDIKNLDFKEILSYEYTTPSVKKYEWDRVLDESGVMRLLNNIVK